jgi:hypothetical protein
MTRQKREAEQKTQTIRVREYCGTYIATGGGKRASNTRGPMFAAGDLASKIFGNRPFNLTSLAEKNTWRASAIQEAV